MFTICASKVISVKLHLKILGHQFVCVCVCVREREGGGREGRRVRGIMEDRRWRECKGLLKGSEENVWFFIDY